MVTCMKCPASMCPLIAPNGSPWSGEYDAECPGHDDLDANGCAWWGMACGGGRIVHIVDDAENENGNVVVAGPNKPRRKSKMTPKTYDCQQAHECRWQEQSSGLCPPREAMARGLDPRIVLF